MIPAVLGMAFTLLAIPWDLIKMVWRDLGRDPGPNVANEDAIEQGQVLRGPDTRARGGRRFYPRVSWADEEAALDQESPQKKTVIGVPLDQVNRFLRASAPHINSALESGQAPSGGCEAGLA